MKDISTLFLKLVLAVIGLATILFCLIVLPMGIRAEDPDMYRPILIGLYLPAIPFLFALYQSFRILNYIDNKTAFSDLTVKALSNIKLSGFAISGLFAAGIPFIFRAADNDDAPGVVLIALVIIFASFVIAVGAAVFQSLMKHALEIKSENDMTV